MNAAVQIVKYPRGPLGNAVLAAHMRDIRAAHPDYGARRVLAELSSMGVSTSRKRLARLMRDRQMRGPIPPRKPTNAQYYAPRLVHRLTFPERLNQVWVGDITYLATREGWLYLAVWIDLRSRLIVGWAASTTPNAQLAITALRAALKSRKPRPGLIVHTDRGVQYSCAEFCAEIKRHRLTQSMSRTGNCHDNAIAESFFAALKREVTRALKQESRAVMRANISHYLGVHYNYQRRHSTIGYLSPAAFEELSPAKQRPIVARAKARARARAARRRARLRAEASKRR